MKKIAWACVAALLLGSVSCALFTKSIPPYPRGVVFPLKEGATLDYEGGVIGSAVRDGALLFLATTKGEVCAFDLVKRQAAWSFKTASAPVCAPAAGPDRVFICDAGQHLYALDNKDGRVLWDTLIKDAGVIALTAGADKIFLTTTGGTVIALASGDGRESWRYQGGAAVPLAPVFWTTGRPHLLVFTGDGTLHLIAADGTLMSKIMLGQTPSAPPLVESGFLYFGGTDRVFRCFNLTARKTEWKVKLGGTAAAGPLALGPTIFLWTSHGVVYCMDKTDGDILWWKSVGSRLDYPPAIVEDKVLVSVSSPSLKSFAVKTGEESGEYDTGRELEGPPLWVDPWLVVNSYDHLTEKGRLIFLQKDVSVSLKPAKEPPQRPGEEVVFVAKATGFFMPKFEFVLSGAGGTEEIVQKSSDRSNWSWYPDKDGDFKVTVRVADAKEKADAEVTYSISSQDAKKEPPKKKAPKTKK
jgi:outer membrane protein assembly factor BamB